jgi:hypothetical protein
LSRCRVIDVLPAPEGAVITISLLYKAMCKEKECRGQSFLSSHS